MRMDNDLALGQVVSPVDDVECEKCLNQLASVSHGVTLEYHREENERHLVDLRASVKVDHLPSPKRSTTRLFLEFVKVVGDGLLLYSHEQAAVDRHTVSSVKVSNSVGSI